MNVLRTATVVLLLSSPAWAQVSTDKIAQVRADEAKAMKEIAARYDGRKLTSAERKQRGQEETAAKKAVMQKHGVDPKAFTRSQSKLSRAEQAKVKAKVEELSARAEAEAASGSASGAGGDAEAGGGDSSGVSVQVGKDDGSGDDEEGAGGVVIEMPDEK